MKKESPIFNDYGMTQWNWLVRHRENFKLGKDTQIGSFTVIDAMVGVEIQDNALIGFGVVILSYSSIGKKSGKVILKKNCRIGSNSTIMPGVTIGENSVVGANSFVSQSIPDNEVWFGIPARLHKKINKI